MAQRTSTSVGGYNTQPNSAQPADAYMANQQARAVFLGSAIDENLPIAPLTSTGYQPQQITIPSVGLARFVRLLVHAVVTNTGTNTDTAASASSPYSIGAYVDYRDPAGIQRIHASFYDLYLRMISLKDAGQDPSYSPETYAYSQYVWANPVVASSGGTDNHVLFWVDVPFIMHERDTRGMINLEAPGQNSNFQISLNPNMYGNGDDAPYIETAGNMTVLNSVSIQPQYYFYSPTYVQNGQSYALPIPTADLQVCHELAQLVASGLTAGNENQQILPTGRSYYRIWQRLVLNGLQQTGKIDGTLGATTATQNVIWKYDANNRPQNESLWAYLARTRTQKGRDLPTGVTLHDLCHKPWNSDHYGQIAPTLNLQSGAVTSGNTYLETFTEALYLLPSAGPQ